MHVQKKMKKSREPSGQKRSVGHPSTGGGGGGGGGWGRFCCFVVLWRVGVGVVWRPDSFLSSLSQGLKRGDGRTAAWALERATARLRPQHCLRNHGKRGSIEHLRGVGREGTCWSFEVVKKKGRGDVPQPKAADSSSRQVAERRGRKKRMERPVFAQDLS